MADSLRRLRSLVVDRAPDLRAQLGRALGALGFEVVEAESGPEALRMADRTAPDLILLAAELPDLDGFETCQRLRRRKAMRDVPILLGAGRSDPDVMDRAFRAGATDFLELSGDWQLLQHRVRFAMRATHASSGLRRTLVDLRSSQERLANAQRLASIGHWEWVPGEDDMLWSEETYRILGYEPGAGASTLQAFLAAVHPEDRDGVEKTIREHAIDAWSLDHRIRTSAGERAVHQQAELVRDLGGGVQRVSGIIQDVTERRRADEQIRYLVYYDSLTALPNRRMLLEHLGRVIQRAQHSGHQLALAFLGLDRFKRVNDTLGHDVGDELLKAVAQRLLYCVRTTDYVSRSQLEGTVSRLGGDEFTVVLGQIRSAEDAATVARRLQEALRAPFSLHGRDLRMSASIGIAVFPGDGQDAETLLQNADTAMCDAKERGDGSFQFFDASMNERARRNLGLESGLRQALERDELRVEYQPQRNVATGRIDGVEALVRWHSAEFGRVEPGEFIPLAEDTGLIQPIGAWVLSRALAQASEWSRQGLPALRMAVNVSSHQVRRAELVDRVAKALREADYPPELLELEITESALIGDVPAASETLAGLKRLGVRLALDDFGTGYSSLSHLVRFPIDILKIDRTFVRALGTDEQAGAVITAVAAMAQRLGLTLVAEGVETEAQVELLRAEGCDVLQGYWVGKPMGADALASLVREDA